MSGSANVQVESANGRLAEISKCLSQQMSKPSQLKSRQQMSVSKSPVGKCQIGVYPHTGTRTVTLIFQFDKTTFGKSFGGRCPGRDPTSASRSGCSACTCTSRDLIIF